MNLSLNWTFFLVASSFGPYVIGGLRIEHAFIPFFALFFLVRSLLTNSGLNLYILLCAFSLMFSSLVLIISSHFSNQTGNDATPFTMWARIVLPAFLFLGLSFYKIKSINYLTESARVIVFFAISSTLLTSLSIAFEMDWFFEFFVRHDEDSVWLASKDLNRFLGVFNQPLEAGVFYSIALICFGYLLHNKEWRGSFLKASLIFLAISIGGLLSLSKNFLIVGVFCFLLFLFLTNILSLSFTFFVFTFVFSLFILYLFLVNDTYLESFLDLYNDSGFLMAITAGRLGGESEVSALFNDLSSSYSYLYGFGLGSHLPLDNGYLEFFYQGGLLSLIGYVSILLFFIFYSILKFRHTEAKLLFCVSVFAILASLGGPVITAGRANISLILLICSCVISISRKHNNSTFLD